MKSPLLHQKGKTVIETFRIIEFFPLLPPAGREHSLSSNWNVYKMKFPLHPYQHTKHPQRNKINLRNFALKNDRVFFSEFTQGLPLLSVV